MNSAHAQALRSFARELHWLLALRLTVHWLTGWFFIWGVVVLALRIGGWQNSFWFVLGLAGVLPLGLFAAWRAGRQRPALANIRASYDGLNACGGLMMAAEAGDMEAWQARLPAAAVPQFRWQGGRALGLLGLSALFVATALLLPERLAHLGGRHPLEIGQTVQELQAEVQTLAQEKILDDQKANDLQRQLAALQKDSSGFDPDKTWEALDHIKQANGDAAKQAAEEALKKTEALTEAGTLAKAMEQAADQGMDPTAASQAAQDLASMLNDAKLEDGILNEKIPPELLAGLNGLNKEQMQKLLSAMEFNKNAMGLTMSNLANLKMIDPETLAKCQNAGQYPNPAALADYLAQCQGNCNSEVLFSWIHHRGRGGPGGGGPEAPMDWDNNTSEDNLKFKEHALPPATHFTDAQLVGVSKAAPELSDAGATAQPGALDQAQAGGGSGHTQLVLPEYRQAVQNYFKRDP